MVSVLVGMGHTGTGNTIHTGLVCARSTVMLLLSLLGIQSRRGLTQLVIPWYCGLMLHGQPWSLRLCKNHASKTSSLAEWLAVDAPVALLQEWGCNNKSQIYIHVR
jgi:hypothetical protein